MSSVSIVKEARQLYEQEERNYLAIKDEHVNLQFARKILCKSLPSIECGIIVDYCMGGLHFYKDNTDDRIVNRINEIAQNLLNVRSKNILNERTDFIKKLGPNQYCISHESPGNSYTFKELIERINEAYLAILIYDALRNSDAQHREKIFDNAYELLVFFDSGIGFTKNTSLTCLALKILDSRLFALSLCSIKNDSYWYCKEMKESSGGKSKTIGYTYWYVVDNKVILDVKNAVHREKTGKLIFHKRLSPARQMELEKILELINFSIKLASNENLNFVTSFVGHNLFEAGLPLANVVNWMMKKWGKEEFKKYF